MSGIPPSPRPTFQPPPAVDTSIQWPGGIVIAFTALAFVVMAGEWVGPDIVFSALLAFFVAFGTDPANPKMPRIVSVNEAAAGYGNSGLLTVMFLYTMAEGMTQTGGLEYIMSYVLGRSRSTYNALVRMTLPVAFISAFLNNTPLVTIFTPILISWGRRNGVPIKKLLIPLSYAAVLGGTCTLIGTSTNIAIAAQQDCFQSVKFKLFDIAPWGVPYCLWGLMFIYVTQGFLLPGNTSRHGRNLLMGLRILLSSLLPGKTIESSGLAKAHGCSVIGVGRSGEFIGSPPLDFIIAADDIIYFAGELNAIEFVGEEHGLALVTQEVEERFKEAEPSQAFSEYGAAPYTKLIRLTVKKGSDLIGQHVRNVNLRSRFNMTLVAIKRTSSRPDVSLSDTVLSEGDMLIADVGSEFEAKSATVIDQFADIELVKDGLAKEFVIAMRVKKGPGDVTGKTLSQAGLRGIPGLHPMSVDKADGRHLEATDYSVRLEPGDVVWFAADLSSIGFLNRFIGLELVQQEQVDKTSTSILYRQFAQAAVASNGPLVGKSVRDCKIRTRYNAAVVAVHRQDARIPLKVADIVLQANDILLLSCDPKWCEEHRHDKAFVLIKDVPNSSPPKRKGMIISVVLVVGLVITQIIGGIDDREYLNLWPCSVLVGMLMLATGCMSADQWRKSFLWDVYLTIAAAFGISQCFFNTYVARNFAEVFIKIGKATDSTGGALVAIYLATAMLSEMLTNNAAGVIMYPIASIAGESLGVNIIETSVAIMLGASAGFINPFSYQTNLMVYAAGGYTFKEFAIIGAPFQLFLAIVAGFILVFRNDWRTVWIVSWVVYAVVAGLPLLYNLIPARITQPFEDAIMKPFRRGPAVVRRTRASDESGSSRQDKAVSLVEVHEL